MTRSAPYQLTVNTPGEGALVAPEKARLSRDAIRRLCVGIVMAEQDRLLRVGGLGQDRAAVLRQPNLTVAEIDRIKIDEGTLGFDSLGTLDLILIFNRFFSLHLTGIEDYLLVRRRVGDWVDLLAEHLHRAPSNLALTFSTSGSSGPPKTIQHPLSRLETEILSLLAGPLTGLSKRCRIIALVPPQHIYGFLFTVLLPSLVGLDVVDLHRAGPTSALRCARTDDLIIGTPMHWENLARVETRLPDGVIGMVSAGPSTEATWLAAQRLGLASLTEIYGSTETAGIGTRQDFKALFDLMPHLVRSNEGIADANDDQRRSLPLQDHLVWVEPGRFRVLGRIDDVVQIAGVNVSPALVRKVICEVEGVHDAVIRREGNRLKAFVKFSETAPDPISLELSIRTVVEANLPAAARPASFRFGIELPRNAMGKLCDWTIDGPVQVVQN